MLTDDQYVDIGETEWVQKDGTPILYRQMDVSHLENTVALIQRKVDSTERWLAERRARGDRREYAKLSSRAAEMSVRATIMLAYWAERVRRGHKTQALSAKRLRYEETRRVHAP